MAFTRPDGGVDRYELTPVGWPAYLQGGGYHDGFADRLGRGVYRGEDQPRARRGTSPHAVDVGDPSGLVPSAAGRRAEQLRDLCQSRRPDDRGFGHLECVLAP